MQVYKEQLEARGELENKGRPINDCQRDGIESYLKKKALVHREYVSDGYYLLGLLRAVLPPICCCWRKKFPLDIAEVTTDRKIVVMKIRQMNIFANFEPWVQKGVRVLSRS